MNTELLRPLTAFKIQGTTYKLVLLSALLLGATMVDAATRTSTATGGVWATGSTWVGGVAPTTTDIAVIATTGTNLVSVGTSTSCAGVTVNAGAKLTPNNRTLTVNGIVSNSGTITITTGGITQTTASNFTNSGTITLTTGRITQSGTGNLSNSGTITYSGAGRLYLTGSYTNTGSMTLGSSGLYFQGANTAASTVDAISTTGLITCTRTAGTITFVGNVNGNGLTLSGTGGTIHLGSGLDHTFTGAITITAGTLNGGSSTLHANLVGTAWSRTGTFTAGTGTVDFGGAGNQSITGSATTFNNLTFSTSGTKSLTAVPTVNGILSMEGTATASAAPTFGAAATIQYKGTAAARTTGVEFPAAFAGTGGVIIDQGGTNTITLGGTKTAFNGDIHVQSGVFDLSNFTINRGSPGGTLAVGANTVLRIGGTNTLPSNYSTHSIDAASTIDYDGTNQTVAGLNSAQAYGNLLLSASGTKAIASTVADIVGTFTTSGTAVAVPSSSIHFGGKFTLGSGTTFNAGSYTHTLDGNFENNGATFNAAGSTFQFNGSAPQSIGGTSSSTFQDLTLNNAMGVTLGIDETVNGTFTVGSGAVVTTGAFSHTLGGNFVNNGSSFDATGSTITFNGGSAQAIGGTSPTTFNNLTLNNASGVTMNGSDIVIASPGTLLIAAGRTLTLENGPLLTIPSGATATTGVGSKIILKSGARYLNLSTSTPTLEVQRQLTGTKGWRMLSAPVASTYSDMFKSPLVTQGFTGSSFPTLQPNLLWWLESDGGTSLQSWRQPSNLTDALVAGHGYFHYTFDGAGRLNLDGSPSGSNYPDVLPLTVSATGTENYNGSGSFNYSLTYTPKSTSQTPSPTDTIYYDLNALDEGWNLIGNPTASTLDWDAVSGWTKTNIDNSIYVWDPSALSGNGDYLTWNGSVGTLTNGRITPFQAFWVHANSAPALSFDNNVKTSTAGSFLRSIAADESISIPITLSIKDLSTTSYVSFSDRGVTGPDRWDAYRLESMSENRVDLFTLSSPDFVSPLVINNLPMIQDEPVSIPLYYDANSPTLPNGSNISLSWSLPSNWPSDWNISLLNHRTQEVRSMKTQSSYSFDAVTKKEITPQIGTLPMPKSLLKPLSTNNLLRSSSTEQPFSIVIYKGSDIPYLSPKPSLVGSTTNPFRLNTNVRFSLPKRAKARIEIYSAQGKKVLVLADDVFPAGITEIPWNASNLAPNLYLIRFVSGSTVEIKKSILIH